MIRILLVDDQKMIREALKVWLEPETDFQIIGTADNGVAAVEQVERLQPDIVVMNMEMPGLDGAGATQLISNKFNDTKVLILSSDDSNEYVAKSLSVGAKGYLLKNTDFQDIAAAIRSVYRGYTQIGPGLLEKLLVQNSSSIAIDKIIDRSGEVDNLSSNTPLSREKLFIAKAKKAINSLQTISRKHRTEIDNLNSSLEQIKQESFKTSKIISRHSKYFGLTWLFLLVSVPVVYFNLFNLQDKTNSLAQNSIPIERIGLYGEYDLSGLAQRVATTFQKDLLLSDISTIHISQNGDTILLKGTVSDESIVQRMKNLAKDVKGVKDVDITQVDVNSADKITSTILIK